MDNRGYHPVCQRTGVTFQLLLERWKVGPDPGLRSRCRDGTPVPAPENLSEVIQAGGVVLLPAAINQVKDLPRELR